MMKLLTIVIPTYNRARSLEQLLHTLAVECDGLQDRIDIIISDNASTDRTSDVVDKFRLAWQQLLAIRQHCNVGPEENFCRCLDHVESKYFWIIGDDDLPKAGFVSRLVVVLDRERPDLVAMASEWADELSSSSQGRPLGELRLSHLNQAAFAARINVWMTFISGIVINRETFLLTQPMSAIRRWSGTSLVQLSWVFGVLACGSRFIQIHNRCVLATSGNSGGYAAMTVFAGNFPRITREAFGYESSLVARILKPTAVGYLPGLAWMLRTRNLGDFHAEDAWVMARQELGRYPEFWLTVFPVMKFPKLIALPFLVLSRLWSFAILAANRNDSVSASTRRLTP